MQLNKDLGSYREYTSWTTIPFDLMPCWDDAILMSSVAYRVEVEDSMLEAFMGLYRHICSKGHRV